LRCSWRSHLIERREGQKRHELARRHEQQPRIFFDPSEDFLEAELLDVGDKRRQRALGDDPSIAEATDSHEQRWQCGAQNTPRSRRLVNPADVTMMWSYSSIPMSSPARCTALVKATSSPDGSRPPLGWLWAKMKPQAMCSIAG